MTSCNGFDESELELRWYSAEDGRHWLPMLAENMILPPCCEFQRVLRVVNNRLKSEHGQNTAAAVARWLPDTPIVGEDGQEGQSDGSWFVTMARVLFAGKEGRTPSRALPRATQMFGATLCHSCTCIPSGSQPATHGASITGVHRRTRKIQPIAYRIVFTACHQSPRECRCRGRAE